MDGRSIYDIDRSPFSFTGMASTMPEAMRAAKMLDILMVKCFTATKVQRLINCFGGYLHRFFGVALFVLTTLIFAPETILIPASPE